MEVRGQLLTSADLHPQAPQYLFSGRLGVPHSRSGQFGEEINLLPVPRIEPRSLSRQSHSLVAMRTIWAISVVIGNYMNTLSEISLFSTINLIILTALSASIFYFIPTVQF